MNINVDIQKERANLLINTVRIVPLNIKHSKDR